MEYQKLAETDITKDEKKENTEPDLATLIKTENKSKSNTKRSLAPEDVDFDFNSLRSSENFKISLVLNFHSNIENSIPPNWETAKNHVLAKRVAREIDRPGEKKICHCCGYEIDRQEISLLDSPNQLDFLGSGFPLYFNFLKYTIYLYLLLLIVSGIFNIYSNYNGNFCLKPKHKITKKQLVLNEVCHLDWISMFTSINRINNQSAIEVHQWMQLASSLLIMLFLLFFRYKQKQIDNVIDINFTSPVDYSVIIRKIPKGLGIDYTEELKQFFTSHFEEDLEIRKVCLTYKIEEISKKEAEIQNEIKKKQKFLKLNSDLVENFDQLHELNQNIKAKETELSNIKKKIIEDSSYFGGVAFISFSLEERKEYVLEKIKMNWKESLKNYLNPEKVYDLPDGLHPGIGLIYHGICLEIEEAPEPKDIDWRFITSNETERRKLAIISLFKTIGIIVLCLLVIFGIVLIKMQIKKGFSNNFQKNESSILFQFFPYINIIISVLIVLFNTFMLGPILMKIIVYTYYFCNILDRKGMRQKQSYLSGIFVNTALLPFIVQFFLARNYYSRGGFIYTEFWLLFNNVFIPQIIYIVDPWTLIKKYQKWRIFKNKDDTILTQKEAHTLLEHPTYGMPRRYTETTRTIWVTFFFASLIPMGIIWSLVFGVFYYWIDKYNLLRRRTVNESISIGLTIEMIEMLEMIIPLYGIGIFIFDFTFFSQTSRISIAILVLGIIYAMLPMQMISEYLFPVEKEHETQLYEDVEIDFDNDYDRENPVTNKSALYDWMKKRKEKHEILEKSKSKSIKSN